MIRARADPMSVVEQYFARSLGFSQLTLGLVVVCLTGAVPLGSLADSKSKLHREICFPRPDLEIAQADAVSPFADAVILLSSLYHSSTAFYSYTRFNATNTGGFLFGAVGSGLMAAFGLWCLMFGSGSHISKRTGADKRTSGFPFKNAEASKRKGKKL
jgi:hypothetical protein